MKKREKQLSKIDLKVYMIILIMKMKKWKKNLKFNSKIFNFNLNHNKMNTDTIF